MPDFLATFNKQNAKSYGNQKIGTGQKGLSFVDVFASQDNPKLRKKLTQYYKQQEEAKAVPIKEGLKRGMSWEDISTQSGLPLQEVQSISQRINPNYGIKAPAPSLINQAVGLTGNVLKAGRAVIDDATGLSRNQEQVSTLQSQLLDKRKEQIANSGVLSPATKKKLLDEIKATQEQAYNARTAQLTQEGTSLQRAQDLVRNPAAVGIGVVRSGQGLAQGVGGIADLITPGEGQNRLTQVATRGAEGSDQFVKDNNMNKGLYLGGQLTGEALQMLTGAKAIKAMASLPGASKLVAVAGKADELEKALMSVNKGGKVGEAAIKSARYLLDPARVANVLQNTAVDQGQIAARGQDINAKTVGTSVAANYALGGVLDAASAGLARKFGNGKAPTGGGDITVYSGGKEATGWATENKNFAKTFVDEPGAKLNKQVINKNDILDVRIPEHRALLEQRLGKDKVDELISRTSNGLPTSSKPGEQDLLLMAGKDLGFKHIALSETDKLTKFKGKDVVSYADTSTAVIPKRIEAVGTADTPVPTELPGGGTMGGTAPATTDIQRLAQVQRKIATAQRQGGLGPDEARALMQERTALIDRIQNPTTAQATPDITTPTTTNLASAVEPGATLAGDIPTTSRAPGTPGESVPMAAQRLEADAIKADLVDKGTFDLQATPNAKVSDWVDKSVALMDSDFNTATKVAMGELNAPSDVPASVVFEAVKKRAIENKDKMLLYQLSKSNVPSQGKEAGQFIKGFDTRNPSDPVVVMQDILKARNDSKLDGMPRDLTGDEISKITGFTDNIEAKKASIPEGAPQGSPERLAYGEAIVNLRRYKNELLDSTKTGYQKLAPKGLLNATAGTAKSIKAALDNSFFGRQGLKVLTTHPTVWAKAFAKSFGDISKGVRGIDALDALDADLLSRPNAIAGVYNKMGIDLHSVEESFPSNLPEKIPALGRLFKASEYAYVGGAHRMRADLADMLLEKAQRANVDIADKEQLQGIGKLINSMTGRGSFGKHDKGLDIVNNLFFSPRNWKSNLDTLTAFTGQKMTRFGREEAAKNLLKMIAVTGSTMALANEIVPGSAELDPRSSNFGKIKIGNTRFDISGGIASIPTVVARLATQSTKNSTTGIVTKLNQDTYGARTTWDVLMDYAEGKMSPATAGVKQLLTRKDFAGDPVTPGNFAKDLFMPLPISNYQELSKDPKSANKLIAMIADGLGIGTNTYGGEKDWNKAGGVKLQSFKKSVDQSTFDKANQEYNQKFNDWFDNLREDPIFRSYDGEKQKKILGEKSQKLTEEILKSHNFDYKAGKKSSEDKREKERLLNL